MQGHLAHKKPPPPPGPSGDRPASTAIGAIGDRQDSAADGATDFGAIDVDVGAIDAIASALEPFEARSGTCAG